MSGEPFKIPGLGQLPDNSPNTAGLAADVAIALQYALAEKEKLAALAATDRPSDSTTVADAQIATPVAGNDDLTSTHDEMNVGANGEKDVSNDEEKDEKLVDSNDAMEIEIDDKSTEPTTTSPATEAAPTEAAPIEANGDGAHERDITSTLDAALALEDVPQAAEAETESGQAEWEIDSDPYQSSSEDSSDDSSDDDSDDDQPMLGLEETVRLLMAADDNDGDGDGNSRPGRVAAPLRTKNELVEEPLPKPNVTITPEMKIELVGHVMSIVDTTVVIQSLKDGETRVLNSGAVLCKEDRTVIGALADTFGPVRDPKYLVIFDKPEEIKELGLERGTPIYYSVVHADYVFTQALKQEKGTDASNLHDEEVAPEDMEFSDDEKEAAYRKALRSKKKAGKAGRGRDQNFNAEADQGALNYDEDEDGPYRPLQRPGTFAQGVPSSLPPRPQGYAAARPTWSRGSHRGRGPRGGHRGGHRGGRGGSNYDGGISAPFPMPQREQTGQGYQQPIPPPPPQWGGQTPFPVPPVPFPQPPQAHPQQFPSGSFNFGFQGWNQGQQAAQPGPGYIPQPWPTQTPVPPPAPAYGNPTFFQGHAHGQQNPGQGQPQAHWPNGQSPT